MSMSLTWMEIVRTTTVFILIKVAIAAYPADPIIIMPDKNEFEQVSNIISYVA